MRRPNKLFHSALHRWPWCIGWKAQGIRDLKERNVMLTALPLLKQPMLPQLPQGPSLWFCQRRESAARAPRSKSLGTFFAPSESSLRQEPASCFVTRDEDAILLFLSIPQCSSGELQVGVLPVFLPAKPARRVLVTPQSHVFTVLADVPPPNE